MKAIPIISFNPSNFEFINHSVETDDATQAILELVRTLVGGDELLFICGNTFAPFTFDTTIFIESVKGETLNSDRFKFTKREFDLMVIEAADKDNYLDKTHNFCRKLVSKSGLAGEVFEMFHRAKEPNGGWPIQLFNPKKFQKPQGEYGYSKTPLSHCR
jgi:hypothetical protein